MGRKADGSGEGKRKVLSSTPSSSLPPGLDAASYSRKGTKRKRKRDVQLSSFLANLAPIAPVMHLSHAQSQTKLPSRSAQAQLPSPPPPPPRSVCVYALVPAHAREGVDGSLELSLGLLVLEELGQLLLLGPHQGEEGRKRGELRLLGPDC